MTVHARFDKFLDNIKLTDDQVNRGTARREAVVKALNLQYYNSGNATNNSVFVGSWAKYTRIRPPRDVDVLYTLPSSVYERFQKRSGNKQSQLLQEVKSVLLTAYPNTAIRGDGPVVLVPFIAFNVELIPAFSLVGGGHWIPMTDGGGHYKKADYAAEAEAVVKSNTDSAGNTRDLVRMMKRWQGECSVPLKSFHIELLSIDFLRNWEHRGKSKTYYDWMVRDFLAFLVQKANSYVFAPGTGEMMGVGQGWLSKATTAYERAKKACAYEAASQPLTAGDEWQKIFGTDIPRYT